MSAQPKQVSLTAQEAEALKQRVLSQSLSDTDQELLVGLITFNFWLQQQLATAKLTIRKLKGFFGFRKEKKSPSNTPDVEPSTEANMASTGENPADQDLPYPSGDAV